MSFSAIAHRLLKVRPRRGGGVSSYFAGDMAAVELLAADIMAVAGVSGRAGHMAAVEAAADALAVVGIVATPGGGPTVTYTENWDDLSNGASYIRAWTGTSPLGRWEVGNGLNTPIISNTRSVTGSLSLKTPFAATATQGANCEVGFDLGGNYREVTCEYYKWIPANYIHRNVNASSYNNKILRLWSSAGYDTKEKMGMSLAPNGGGPVSSMWAEWDAGDFFGPGNPVGMTGRGTPYLTYITAAMCGAWMYEKWYIKAPTAKGTGPGIIRIWQGTSPADLVLRISEATDNFTVGEPHTFRRGTLMGTANSGYASNTEFFFDVIKWGLVA